MAEQIQVSQTDSYAKKRGPIAVVLLGFVTLGIYFFFWWYFVNREMRDLGRARQVDLGESPGQSTLAISLGALLIIPALVTMWTTSERVAKSQGTASLSERASGPVIFLLLFLIAPVGVWYVQRELNKVWDAEGTAPASVGAAAPATA